jgi:hypothetical protein
MHPQEETVIGGLFRIREDVVAPHPAEKNEADQQEDEDGPTEQTIPWFCTPAVP